MNQEIQTIVRLKNINVLHVSAFDLIDRLTDEELQQMFFTAAEELKQEGRLD